MIRFNTWLHYARCLNKLVVANLKVHLHCRCVSQSVWKVHVWHLNHTQSDDWICFQFKRKLEEMREKRRINKKLGWAFYSTFTCYMHSLCSFVQLVRVYEGINLSVDDLLIKKVTSSCFLILKTPDYYLNSCCLIHDSHYSVPVTSECVSRMRLRMEIQWDCLLTLQCI